MGKTENPNRGEVKLKIADREFIVKLAPDGIQRVERQLKMGCLRFLSLLEIGEAKIEENIFVLKALLKGGNENLTDEEINELIEEEGYTNTYALLLECFQKVLDPSGKARAAAERKAKERAKP